MWLSLLFIPVEILVWNLTFKSQANLGQSLTQVDSAFFCPICYVTRFLYQVKVLDFHCGCHCYLFQLKFWCGILRLSLRPTWVSPWPKLTVPFFCPICYVTRFLYQVKILDFHSWLSLLFIPVEILVWNLTFKSQANLGQSLTQVDSAFFCPICYVTRFLYQVKVLDFHCGWHCYLFQLKFWCGILRLSLRPTWVSPWPKLTVPFFVQSVMLQGFYTKLKF